MTFDVKTIVAVKDSYDNTLSVTLKEFCDDERMVDLTIGGPYRKVQSLYWACAELDQLGQLRDVLVEAVDYLKGEV